MNKTNELFDIFALQASVFCGFMVAHLAALHLESNGEISAFIIIIFSK